jgi:hypothetical protein
MAKEANLIYLINYPKLYLSPEVLGFMQDFHNNETISSCDKHSIQYQQSLGPLIEYIAEMSDIAFQQTRHRGRLNGALVNLEMIDRKHCLYFKRSDSDNK